MADMAGNSRRGAPGRPGNMGTTQEPLNFVAFWTLLGRLAAGLMRQRANGELTLIF